MFPNLLQFLFLGLHLPLSLYSSILYIILDTLFIYSKLLAVYSYKFFISNHMSESGLNLYLLS